MSDTTFVKAEKDEQMAGGYIPRQLSEQLNLIALFHETTRSEIIRALIVERVASAEKLQDIVIKLAERVYSSWREYRKTMQDQGKIVAFPEYIQGVRKTLEHRKIANIHIEMIIIKSKEIYNAHKTSKPKQSGQTGSNDKTGTGTGI